MDIQVSYGHAETYWDVVLPDEAFETAGLPAGVISGISVFVDPESGDTILNRGYVEASAKGRAEARLFDLYLDEIEQALGEEVANVDDPAYEAFRYRLESAGMRL